MGARVSDEVWRHLDRNAGRLSRRAAVRAWIAAAAAVVAWFGAVTLVGSGLVVPHLAWTGSLEASQQQGAVVRVSLPIANYGLASVTLRGVGRSGPGLDLLAAQGPFPVTLGSGEAISITLVYRITDCAAVPRGPWPVTATVDWFWGALTIDVAPPGGPVEQWQEIAVTLYCDR